MTRALPFAAFMAALVMSLGVGLAQAEHGLRTLPAAHHPATPAPPLPGFEATDRADIQVLLSSIDMTVSLIDAYGRCRDDGKSHERCMTIIRNTLEQARALIGH